MKYVDEFRDRGHAETLAGAIKRTVTRPWTIMEVCGGQTHSIVKFGPIACCRKTSCWFMGERGTAY